MSALTAILVFIAGFVCGSVFGVVLLAMLVGGSGRSSATQGPPAENPSTGSGRP